MGGKVVGGICLDFICFMFSKVKFWVLRFLFVFFSYEVCSLMLVFDGRYKEVGVFIGILVGLKMI